MSMEDAMMVRSIMRDISRQPLDSSRLNVNVSNGVVRLSGMLEGLRGQTFDVDLEERLHILVRILRQRPGVRDVITEVDLGGKRGIWEDSNKKKRRRY